MPTERRLLGSALGVVTVAVLGTLLWFVVNRPEPLFPQPPATGGFEAAPLTQLSDPEPVTERPTTVPTSTTRPDTTTTTLSTTTTSTIPTTTSTIPTTTSSTIPPLVLGPDGLGRVGLGDPIDEVRAAVGESLGDPSSDTGWIDSESDFGTCPGTIVRIIRWSSLRLFFSDGPTEYGDEFPHFFYVNNSRTDVDEDVVDVTTAAGIGLGSTVADLRAAYGDDLVVDSTIRFGVTFVVDPDGRGILSGTLSSSSPDGRVTSIAAGFGCGA